MRFWDKVTPVPEAGCWIWTAGTTHDMYAQYSVNGRHTYAHRVAFEALVGRIPDGLQLDHLCRVRCCVNPRHLEAVTGKVNSARGLAGKLSAARHRALTHCANGHEFTSENTGHNKRGAVLWRYCRICARAKVRRYREKTGYPSRRS